MSSVPLLVLLGVLLYPWVSPSHLFLYLKISQDTKLPETSLSVLIVLHILPWWLCFCRLPLLIRVVCFSPGRGWPLPRWYGNPDA